MAETDFLDRGTQISGADITVSPAPSQGTNFLSSFVSGMMKGGGKEKKLKEETDKLTYYTQLREAGYSAEEATARVNKQFSGSFLDRALGKNAAGFEAPKNDNFTSKTSKDKAAAAKDTAMAGYYNRSEGKKSASGGETGNAQRMVSLENMIAGIGKQLNNTNVKKDPEKFKKLENKLGLYQKQLEKLTGVSQGEESDQGGDQSWGNPNDINDLGESDQPEGTKALNKATNKRIVTVNGRWRNA